MTVVEQQGEEEKAAAEHVIASSPLFDGIESVDVTLGEDHTGDPALWLVFKMRPDLEPNRTWIEAFSAYSTKLGLKILDSGVTRFPYHRLERAA